MDGKAFVHRLAHDDVENNVTNRAFQHAVKIGSVEHETSEQLSFFTLRFHEKLLESSVRGMSCIGNADGDLFAQANIILVCMLCYESTTFEMESTLLLLWSNCVE